MRRGEKKAKELESMEGAAAAAAAAVIRHRTVEANGISIHVAEAGGEGGDGAAVLFLHGFPELWYSWRHQMEHLAGRGFRCLAPDLRGYGDTDAPPEIESYSAFHVVGDLVALLDALGLAKVRTSLADANHALIYC